ncbi:hypothetical protein Pelo_4140 [Pelomyxa schiedti]|nr:hypothetical protein Pelo_4140 [Pelomyxa schiedti]
MYHSQADSPVTKIRWSSCGTAVAILFLHSNPEVLVGVESPSDRIAISLESGLGETTAAVDIVIFPFWRENVKGVVCIVACSNSEQKQFFLPEDIYKSGVAYTFQETTTYPYSAHYIMQFTREMLLDGFQLVALTTDEKMAMGEKMLDLPTDEYSSATFWNDSIIVIGKKAILQYSEPQGAPSLESVENLEPHARTRCTPAKHKQYLVFGHNHIVLYLNMDTKKIERHVPCAVTETVISVSINSSGTVTACATELGHLLYIYSTPFWRDKLSHSNFSTW